MMFSNHKLIRGLMVSGFLLGACSSEKGGLLERHSHVFKGLTAQEEPPSQWNEKDAKDFADYVSIDVRENEHVPKMNNIPLGQANKDGQKTYAQEIRVSGIVIEMDASRFPFQAYSCDTLGQKDSTCLYNIRSLTVEANKIIVKGYHKFRQTNVQLVADEVVFEKDAVIDVTPLGFSNNPNILPTDSPALKGNDGQVGEASGSVQINAGQMFIKGDLNTPRIIANGGPGQNAGLGRNGVDGISLPSLSQLGKRNIGGQDYDIVYRSYYRYYKKRNCWGPGWSIKCGESEVKYQELGTNQFPTNGQNAIPGGLPGTGGAGGQILIQTPILNGRSLAGDEKISFAQTLHGAAGSPAGSFTGGQPGTPIHAVKLLAEKNDTEEARYVFVTSVSQKGLDASSPETPENLQSHGEAKLMPRGDLPFSAAFYKTRLRMIREKYLNRDFTTVKNEISKDMKGLSRLSEQNQNPELLTSLGKYSALNAQLILAQDYFGHSLSEAPLYALDFNINQFEAEVDMQLQSYFLTQKILDMLSKKQDARDILAKTIQHYNSVAEKEFSLTKVKAAKINDMEAQATHVRQQEEAYNRLLLDLNRQIEERAKAKVDSKHRAEQFKKTIKTLVSLSKVIPAGQPILAAGGALLETITNPPESQSVVDWINYISNTRDGVQAVISDQSFQESRQNLNDFINQLRPSVLEGKSAEEKIVYLQELGKKLGPSYQKIKKISDDFNQSVASADEIQAEIEKIKATDPLFLDASNRLQELLKEKAKLLTTIQSLANDVLESTAIINNSLRLSLIHGSEYLKSVDYGSTRLRDLMKEIQEQSEERLLYIYSEVLKGYEYTTLEKTPESNNFQLLKESCMDLVVKNVTPEEAQPILRSLYMQFINKLVVSLDNKFRQNNPVLILKNDSVVVNMKPAELMRLNNTGLVNIPLDASKYGTHQKNIRISSIEISEARFERVQENTKLPEIEKTFIRVVHGGSGYLEDLEGEKHSYTYPNAQSLHSWGSSFQFINGGIYENEMTRDASVKGLLSILIKDKTNTLLYSPIFSQPAGLANIMIQKMDLCRTPRKVERLQLKINYTFVE